MASLGSTAELRRHHGVRTNRVGTDYPRRSIIAGADASEDDVRRHTERLAGYLEDGSAPMTVFSDIDARDRNASRIKQFPVTIIGIDKEVTSTRAVVLLHTHVNGQNSSIPNALTRPLAARQRNAPSH